MKDQHQKPQEENNYNRPQTDNNPQPKNGVHSPDTEEAAAENAQESDFGSRSYAFPDFFKKKPHL